MLYDVPHKNWLEGWVKSLIDVLEKHRLSESDSILNALEELGARKLNYLEIVVLLHDLDPLVCLRLRVDKEWPSLGLCANDTVFN